MSIKNTNNFNPNGSIYGKEKRSLYTNEDFKEYVFRFLDSYLVKLRTAPKLGKLRISLTNKFIDEFTVVFNQIILHFHSKNIFDNLPTGKKTPHLICASIIYMILQVYYDVEDTKLGKKEYSEILSINYSKFVNCLKHCTLNYFVIDEAKYFQKVLQFYHKYLEKIDKEYNLKLPKNIKTISLKTSIIKYYNDLRTNTFLIPKDIVQKFDQTDEKLYKLLREHRFDILKLYKSNHYHYFFPQYLALILLHFCKEEKAIKNKKNFNFVKLSKLLNLSDHRIQRLLVLFRFALKSNKDDLLFHTKYYSKERFEGDLKKIYAETQRSDFFLLLRLYKLLKLTPEVFAKEIVCYKSRRNEYYSPYYLIKLIKNEIYSIGKITCEKMIKNLGIMTKENKISENQYKKSIELIDNYEFNESNILYHNSIKYGFQFKRNLNFIKDQSIRIKLLNYFYDIIEGNYPEAVFNDKQVSRCSSLCLKGTNNERLLISKIKGVIKHLNNEGLIGRQTTGFLYRFQTEAQITHENYKKLGRIPNHPPILTNLFFKENIIGIEIPVWKEGQDGEYITGHIDVLGFYKNTLVIADYKSNETDIFRYLAQICAYAYLLKQRLNLEGFQHILCIAYSKDVVWAFKPQILEDILDFVRKENMKRSEQLMCINQHKELAPKGMEQEILRILK
ncbi:MAG: hypothetical protein ACXABO_11260 [Promethearchaeota archaeon]|jgi:hypothetical protein